jgi:hypothetical protein
MIGARIEFEISPEQLERLLDACKPTPAMWNGAGQMLFGTPQENANRAWQTLADEMGFVWDTVQPCGKGDRVFTAIAKAQGGAA